MYELSRRRIGAQVQCGILLRTGNAGDDGRAGGAGSVGHGAEDVCLVGLGALEEMLQQSPDHPLLHGGQSIHMAPLHFLPPEHMAAVRVVLIPVLLRWQTVQ